MNPRNEHVRDYRDQGNFSHLFTISKKLELPWESSGWDSELFRPGFTVLDLGSIPGQGTKILKALWHGPKKLDILTDLVNKILMLFI